MHVYKCIALTMLALAPLAAQGQDSISSSSIHPRVPPVANAQRLQSPIAIDGKLDEAVWQTATPVTKLTQSQPHEGQPATQRTEIRILYDDNALYIGARIYDSLGARGIRAPLARRDQLLDGNGNNGSFNSLTTDKIVVILDPYHNHRDQALFEINPVGVKGDQFNGDPSWDPIWQAATNIDSLGWTAELRIPFSQLRFPRDSVQTWGMEIWRYADRLNEQDMWAFWRANEAGGPASFGHLTGLRIPAQPRQFELLPFALSSEQFKYASPADPYHSSSSGKITAGMDLKYLLTSNLTLDATVNPDFGQVEVDPATINLSAYETYYDEKRPFFVAGSSAFDYGGMNCNFCSNTSSLDLFYSRRIGRPPELNGYVSGLAQYADLPDRSAILGAAKVTGRTAGGFTVGLLDALTNRETATYVTTPGGPAFTQEVEPLTNYLVGRVKKDLRDGATTIGTMFTSAARQMSDTVLSDRLRSHAEALGLDWDHRWHQRAYSWMGSLALSDVGGSPQAIGLTEESSAHYFQRPDRRVRSDGLFGTSFDTSATSMRGYALYTRLAKSTGDWFWETAQNWRSPGFEVNDLSYLNRADYKWMNFNVGHTWTTPGKFYRNAVILGGGQQQFNYDGDRTDQQAQAFGQVEFLNYWNVRSFLIYHPSVLDDRLTRGGPVVMRSGYRDAQVQVSTDPRGRAVFNIAVEGGPGIDASAHNLTVSPGVALKPLSSVFVSLTPTFSSNEDPAQYVTTQADPTATAFFGERYVFAYLRSTTWSLDTRVNVTFTPNITLQLYAQPYFASGDYSSFREFARPRTPAKLVYGKDIGTIVRTGATPTSGASYTVDPDGAGPAQAFTFADPNFAYRSLIGNAVLRWEYRPGSTLFFVWTQNRTGTSDVGNFDFTRDRQLLFRDRPTNVFQVKLNYWIGR
ncbi:MAG: carbohydrate binding family 9 domain-containing protein [Gemmatimonadota bacterium]|nr:carbohydrate binding family 9 domain-containing protein [Gemmatimonadota bacterium]